MLEWVVRMEYKFTIPGRLDGLNEYTAANRTNPHKGGHMKQKNEDGIIWQIRRQLPGIGTITAPVLIYYRFFEKDRRRDNDNILSCAAKFVQDSLKKGMGNQGRQPKMHPALLFRYVCG